LLIDLILAKEEEISSQMFDKKALLNKEVELLEIYVEKTRAMTIG
jgi:hypothetical protein